MNPERWQQLRKLFQAAIEQDPARRAAFLDGACVGDPALREEVEALLANYDSKDSFLEKPAYESAAELFDSDAGDSLVGRHLGQYVVTQKIGRGGMGIVYLAEDTRLDRLVAIKALAPQYTREAQHRERLRREARAAARLTHPGIATVYALEEFDDNLYIVYEYVRGVTLRDELAKGPMPTSSVLDIGVKAASALAAAHEQGVIHRDLKPDNMMRTDDGGIKILDFGLARIRAQQPRSSHSSRLTEAGAFVGTPAYSAPERLLGAEVDFRTDIFSFGVLLYELTSGIHPFVGSDSFAMIARILEAEPADLAQICSSCPPELDRIIRRCLCKDPEQRYETTRELLADLEALMRDLAVSSADPQVDRARSSAAKKRSTRRAPMWWWQFHQACAGIGYYLMLYPLWQAKQWTPGILGSLLFFPALVAVGISANLRFHLWFSSQFYPAELPEQLRRTERWIRWSDVLFALLLLVGAVVVHDSHATVATLLVAVAVGSSVAFTLIEPATARAALGTLPERAIRAGHEGR